MSKRATLRFVGIFFAMSILMAVLHTVGMLVIKDQTSPYDLSRSEALSLARHYIVHGLLFYSLMLLVVGGPIMVLARMIRRQTIWTGLLIGLATCYAAVIFISIVVFQEDITVLISPIIILVFAVVGLISGVFFWWFAYRPLRHVD